MKNCIFKIYLISAFFILQLTLQGQYYFNQSQNLPIPGSTGQTMDVEAADLDGDGDIDIILANEFQPNTILFNDGAGFFTDVSATQLPQVTHDSEDIGIADFNNDGYPDIIFVSEDDFIHEIYLNDGNGFFTTPEYSIPNSICNAVIVKDINGDSLPDILLGNNGQNMIFINDQGNGFIDQTSQFLPQIIDVTQDLKLADLDSDGDLDLFVGNEDGNRILINTNGVFNDESLSRLPQGLNIETRKIEFGDFDNDSDLDVMLSNVEFISGKDRQNRIYKNNGLGFFSDITAITLPLDDEHTLDAIFIDINNDGFQDIIRVDFPDKPFLALFNNGEGVFIDSTQIAFSEVTNINGLGIAEADLNNDGLMDIYLCSRSGQDILLIRNPELVSDIKNLSNNDPFDVKIYPNPSTGIINIENGEKYYLKVTNLEGQTVINANGIHKLDLSDLPKGAYQFYFGVGPTYLGIRKVVIIE